MRIAIALIAALAMVGVTAAAAAASVSGWGLPDTFEEPQSIRQGSVRAGVTGGTLLYFGGRSHRGGGFSHGK